MDIEDTVCKMVWVSCSAIKALVIGLLSGSAIVYVVMLTVIGHMEDKVQNLIELNSKAGISENKLAKVLTACKRVAAQKRTHINLTEKKLQTTKNTTKQLKTQMDRIKDRINLSRFLVEEYKSNVTELNLRINRLQLENDEVQRKYTRVNTQVQYMRRKHDRKINVKVKMRI